MNVYLESSAVLRWLLEQEDGQQVREQMLSSKNLYASELTAVECARTIRRLRAENMMTASAAQEKHAALEKLRHKWNKLPLSSQVLERASQSFPLEPVRSLDAIHLASALIIHAVRPLAILSFDSRVRKNAVLLGMEVLPGED